jgi:hypothetical protein
MDIEGAEKEVLLELEKMDKLKYIKNIVVECHNTNISDILKRNGFDISEKNDSKEEKLVYVLGKNTSKESI